MSEPAETNPESGPEEAPRPTHSEDGVDLTLIRWMLSLTPRERLLVAQKYAQSIVGVRRLIAPPLKAPACRGSCAAAAAPPP